MITLYTLHIGLFLPQLPSHSFHHHRQLASQSSPPPPECITTTKSTIHLHSLHVRARLLTVAGKPHSSRWRKGEGGQWREKWRRTGQSVLAVVSDGEAAQSRDRAEKPRAWRGRDVLEDSWVLLTMVGRRTTTSHGWHRRRGEHVSCSGEKKHHAQQQQGSGEGFWTPLPSFLLSIIFFFL